MKSFAFLILIPVFILGFLSCDKNEYPPDISDQNFSLAENSPAGTLVGTVLANDNDEGQTLGFEIVDGNEDDAFQLDYSSGSLSVNSSEIIDFEEKEQFLLTISVTDNHKKNPLESTAEVNISILDMNEYAPSLSDQAFSIAENSPSETLVGTVLASDDDVKQELGFTIIDGDEEGVFQLDYSSGSLSVNNPEKLDYEKTEKFALTISVTDNHADNPLDSSAMVQVDLLNIIEIPQNGIQAYYNCNNNTDDISDNEYHFSDPGLSYGVDRSSVSDETFIFNGSIGLTLLSQAFNNQSEAQTVSLWFKTESLNTVEYGGLLFGVLGRAEAGSGSRFTVTMKNGILRGGYGDEWADDNKWNESLESSSTLNDNIWHHIVFVSNGDNQEAVLIIDNEIVDSRVLSKSNNSKVDNIDFKIGGDKTENYFTGEIDEVLYYKRALTGQEVTAIFLEKWR